MNAPSPVPEGFVKLDSTSPFHELVGPLYEMRDDDSHRIGFVVAEKHKNRRGIVHGGMICTLADFAMGHAAALAGADAAAALPSACTTRVRRPARPSTSSAVPIAVTRSPVTAMPVMAMPLPSAVLASLTPPTKSDTKVPTAPVGVAGLADAGCPRPA